ncbi:hypothetical protein [Frankia sp. AgB32]|uniref:hypothetical protein n=1 Tax=Frankia sp. AgB32 TaxID=631119 RepID=UPI00200D9645|nr:hypothetical protein [Frankia sp. AgB32]MCK9896844.1 hypothetical protein [Frankia sp. AgB32]
MDIVLHPITGAPPPHLRAWVDAVLATVQGEAGVLVSHALGMPSRQSGVPGYLLTAWADPADADRAAAAPPVEVGDGVRVGPGRRYPVTASGRGSAATGPARFLQVAIFDGPRGADWVAAFAASGARRVWPVMRAVPGVVAGATAVAEDGAALALVLAESVDALEETLRRTMATPLLPGEDPALLTGPDRVEIHRLAHAGQPEALLAGQEVQA